MISIEARKEINKRTDDIVEKAHNLIDNTEIYKKMDKTQLRNLLNLAMSTDSVKAMENFVYYQMGRKETKEDWKHNSFGNKLLEDLQNFGKMAEEIDKANKKKVWLNIIRLYLGYINRYFVFKKEKEGEDNE